HGRHPGRPRAARRRRKRAARPHGRPGGARGRAAPRGRRPRAGAQALGGRARRLPRARERGRARRALARTARGPSSLESKLLAWPSTDMLVVVQAFAVALGALPVFWLARKHLGSQRAGLGFALAYLLYPATQWLVLNEFHPVALACPLLLSAFWYLDEDRLLP